MILWIFLAQSKKLSKCITPHCFASFIPFHFVETCISLLETQRAKMSPRATVKASHLEFLVPCTWTIWGPVYLHFHQSLKDPDTLAQIHRGPLGCSPSLQFLWHPGRKDKRRATGFVAAEWETRKLRIDALNFFLRAITSSELRLNRKERKPEWQINERINKIDVLPLVPGRLHATATFLCWNSFNFTILSVSRYLLAKNQKKAKLLWLRFCTEQITWVELDGF